MKHSIQMSSVLSSIRVLILASIYAFSFPTFAASIDINTASAEQISDALKGVGPAKAKAIVAYRTEHGPFITVDQLTEVKGIGAATVDKNRDAILISKPEAKPKQ